MTVPFPSRLDNHYCEEEEKGIYGLKFMEAYGALHINHTIPQKEKDLGSFTLPCFINNVSFSNALVDLGASISVMPLLTYLNLRLGGLAHTRLTVELADRTVKYPKGIAKKTTLEPRKDHICPTRPVSKIGFYKRKITLRVGEEKIIFKSVKPAISLIRRVYMLGLRERMELDLEARLMGETLDSKPMKITRMIGSMNGTRTYHGSMRSHGLTLEFGPNPHRLNILASLSIIRLDVQNGQRIVRRMMDTVMEETYPKVTLLKTNSIIKITTGMKLWKIVNLKIQIKKNKAIMEGFINEDEDESRYEQMRQWNIYTNYDDAYEINHGNNKREELCEIHKPPVCNIRKYMMIKYSFNNDEEFVAIKIDEYDDLIITKKEACQVYQEIFWIMDEGWVVTRDGIKREVEGKDLEKEISTNIGESGDLEVLES
ncbi:RNA-directed DNA polymerase, eukaryota [Tanacetum coccineum]